jgi:hypothetical protein
MSKGAATKCKARDVELTADDAGKVLTASGFSFTGARQVKDTIVQRAWAKIPRSRYQSLQLSLFSLK